MNVDHVQKAHAQHSAVGDVLLPVVRGLMTIFITGLGIMLGATVFALAFPSPPGVGAITGGCIGALIFGIIGCCVTGTVSDVFTGDINLSPSFIPHSMYAAVGKHGDFTLVLTVHKAEGVKVSNRVWNNPQLFVEVECGENPLKMSCVNGDGQFEEQFKLQVKASDMFLLLYIKDQQFFGSDTVGHVSLDIQKDIVGPIDDASHADKSFPKYKHFQIKGGNEFTLSQRGDKASLLVSFDVQDIKTGMSPEQERAALDHQVSTKWDGGGYGAINYLPSVQFKRDVQLDMQDEAATQLKQPLNGQPPV